MMFLRNTLYAKSLLLDVFGIGEAVGAGVGAAANITSTVLTNQTNKEIADATNETALQIHREDNQFNADEAEKSRDFNAEQAQITRDFNASEAEKARQFNASEAQKTRDWNSETAISQRMCEAGLNTAMMAGSSTTSSASASSSPASASPVSSSPASASSAPHLVTPVMQAPDISGAVNAGVNFAKAESEISGNKKQAEKTMAETAESLERTKYQSIVNSLTPDKLRSEITYLNSQTDFNKEDMLRLKAITAKEQQLLDSAMMQGYTQWVASEVAKGQLSLEQNKFVAMFSQHQQDVRVDAQKFADEWKSRHYENAFKYGGSNFRSNNISDTRSSSSSNSSELTTSANAGISALGGSISLSDSDSDSSSSTYGSSETSSYNSGHIKNTEYYRLAVESEACLYILTKYSEDKNAVKSALNRIQEINTSVEAYSLVLRQVGKIKHFPQSSVNE